MIIKNVEDVIEFRKKRLIMSLNLLGFYSSKELQHGIHDDNGFVSLQRIREGFENYQYLGFVRRDEARNVILSVPNESVKQSLSDAFIKSEEQLQDDVSYVKARKDYLDRSQDIYETYCKDMRSKVSKHSETDWQAYSDIIKKSAELLLELNADISFTQIPCGIENLSMLYGDDLRKRIATFIYSPEFEKACDIEDRFVVDETTELLKRIDEMGLDDPMVKSSSVGRELTRLKDAAQKEKTDRIRNIQLKRPRKSGDPDFDDGARN